MSDELLLKVLELKLCYGGRCCSSGKYPALNVFHFIRFREVERKADIYYLSQLFTRLITYSKYEHH